MNQRTALTCIFALVAGVSAATVAVERVMVEGDSMQPSLRPGDRLLVVRFLRPRPGDIVAAADPRRPGRRIVKRVEAVLPEARVVLAGDDPARSTDSRHFGPVPAAAVRGRVVWRYAPDSRRGHLSGTRW